MEYTKDNDIQTQRFKKPVHSFICRNIYVGTSWVDRVTGAFFEDKMKRNSDCVSEHTF